MPTNGIEPGHFQRYNLLRYPGLKLSDVNIDHYNRNQFPKFLSVFPKIRPKNRGAHKTFLMYCFKQNLSTNNVV